MSYPINSHNRKLIKLLRNSFISEQARICEKAILSLQIAQDKYSYMADHNNSSSF